MLRRLVLGPFNIHLYWFYTHKEDNFIHKKQESKCVQGSQNPELLFMTCFGIPLALCRQECCTVMHRLHPPQSTGIVCKASSCAQGLQTCSVPGKLTLSQATFFLWCKGTWNLHLFRTWRAARSATEFRLSCEEGSWVVCSYSRFP